MLGSLIIHFTFHKRLNETGNRVFTGHHIYGQTGFPHRLSGYRANAGNFRLPGERSFEQRQ